MRQGQPQMFWGIRHDARTGAFQDTLSFVQKVSKRRFYTCDCRINAAMQRGYLPRKCTTALDPRQTSRLGPIVARTACFKKTDCPNENHPNREKSRHWRLASLVLCLKFQGSEQLMGCCVSSRI